VSSHPDPYYLDPHDPRFELERQDNLTLLALGEPVDPNFQAHHAACSRCQHELATLARTVILARQTDEHSDAAPPASIWNGISNELGIAAHRRDAPAILPARHRMRWRYALAAAAAAVVTMAAAGGGYLLGRHSDGPAATAASHAILRAQPGAPVGVAGTAVVHATDQGHQLTIDSSGLPLRHGYYEVWLYNPASGGMQPVGALADDGSGTFTVAGSIDLRSYDVVDISAQDYGGSTVVHQQSVLQGPLSQ
jgi:anti-sigma-K factor RskA